MKQRINRLGEPSVDAYTYIPKSLFNPETLSYGSCALLFRRKRKKTPLIYPFICRQTQGGVNGYYSIYTPHVKSRRLGEK